MICLCKIIVFSTKAEVRLNEDSYFTFSFNGDAVIAHFIKLFIPPVSVVGILMVCRTTEKHNRVSAVGTYQQQPCSIGPVSNNKDVAKSGKW